MTEVEQLYQQAIEAEPAIALNLLQALLARFPDFPNVWYRIGIILHAQNQWLQAESAYRHELQQRKDFWACRANLSQLLYDTSRHQEAIQEARLALKDCPQPEARAHILQTQARIHKDQGHFNLALDCLEQAQQQTDSAGLQKELARLLLHMGETNQAGRHYLQALRLGASPALQREAAEHLISVQQFPAAISVLESVLRQGVLDQAQQAIVQGQIANAWQELNQPQKAISTYQEALYLHDRASLHLAQALVLPVVYHHQREVYGWRKRLETEILAIGTGKLTESLELGVLPFYAPYQGFNDRTLMESFANCFKSETTSMKPSHYSQKKKSHWRIGCVSHFFYDHSVMRCFADLLLELCQPPFELHCFAASPLFEDALTQRLRQNTKSWTRLQGNLQMQREQIIQSKLDLLIYTDMGLDPHSYFLARHRLAPLQLLLPGQPVTSGLKSLDGFISDYYSEPSDAAEHYTESLIQLNQLPSIYPLQIMPARLKSRSELGLPAGRLYVCPAQAFKIHPMMDAALIMILEQDPLAQLIFLDLTPNHLMMDNIRRLQSQLSPNAAKRIQLLPRLNQLDFAALLSLADVMLESYPFSSYNTLMAAFGVGTPVVTFPGEFLRGRYCYGLYQQMGIVNPPVAKSDLTYADLALKIAYNKSVQQNLRREIFSAQSRIFNNQAVGEEFRQSLLNLLNA